MFDRVFANAVAADGGKVNFAVRDGCFVSIEPECPPVNTAEVIDLGGHLVLPGFVDGHIHLDKSFVGDRWHSHESVTSLRQRLALEKRELALAPPIAERAHVLISQAAGFGTVAMRSHVDVDAAAVAGVPSDRFVVRRGELWVDASAVRAFSRRSRAI